MVDQRVAGSLRAEGDIHLKALDQIGCGKTLPGFASAGPMDSRQDRKVNQPDAPCSRKNPHCKRKKRRISELCHASSLLLSRQARQELRNSEISGLANRNPAQVERAIGNGQLCSSRVLAESRLFEVRRPAAEELQLRRSQARHAALELNGMKEWSPTLGDFS